ncbi:hypothetical protein KKC1_28870 [Calderihabitans maritimus]|uniref:Uncharacterized protein n=1 Tax=Calderihabitans maritimus TaxID=1246530 RepID=A0A1Z5HW48_9FIRM|nr:hypothetical protein KKC1_28870 [Calderihabitans maritimus]
MIYLSPAISNLQKNERMQDYCMLFIFLPQELPPLKEVKKEYNIGSRI